MIHAEILRVPYLSFAGFMRHHATDPNNRRQENPPTTARSRETSHCQTNSRRGSPYTQTARKARGSDHRLWCVVPQSDLIDSQRNPGRLLTGILTVVCIIEQMWEVCECVCDWEMLRHVRGICYLHELRNEDRMDKTVYKSRYSCKECVLNSQLWWTLYLMPAMLLYVKCW